jgi:hypothetical protein
VIFHSVVEYICDVVCNVITFYACVETTSVPYERMVPLQPRDKIINFDYIFFLLLMHLRHVCSCSGVHVFLSRKLFAKVLHQMLKALPHLSLRKDILHYSYQSL